MVTSSTALSSAPPVMAAARDGGAEADASGLDAVSARRRGAGCGCAACWASAGSARADRAADAISNGLMRIAARGRACGTSTSMVRVGCSLGSGREKEKARR